MTVKQNKLISCDECEAKVEIQFGYLPKGWIEVTVHTSLTGTWAPTETLTILAVKHFCTKECYDEGEKRREGT